MIELRQITSFFHNRPRIGLALSGGGAKGFAHLGVLMALESAGIKPDIMAGVSAGSIVAVMYAAGLSVRDIISCFSSYKGFSDFTGMVIPRKSFFKLDKFQTIFESWLPVKDIEELNIPTVVCASDLDNGKSVGWRKGRIGPRVMASCSIPIIFSPIEIGGRHYVDGGVIHNLPAWAIREECDVLLGSNCSPLNQDYTYKSSLPSIAMRTFALMSKSNTISDIKLCDYIIRHHAVASHSTFDMSDISAIVLAGYEAAAPVIEQMTK